MTKMNLGGGASPSTKESVRLLKTFSEDTWYRIYSDGWVEQGGIAKTNSTVSLPIKMYGTSYNILSQPINTIQYWSTLIKNLTTTSFFINSNAPETHSCAWQVSGKISQFLFNNIDCNFFFYLTIPKDCQGTKSNSLEVIYKNSSGVNETLYEIPLTLTSAGTANIALSLPFAGGYIEGDYQYYKFKFVCGMKDDINPQDIWYADYNYTDTIIQTTSVYAHSPVYVQPEHQLITILITIDDAYTGVPL